MRKIQVYFNFSFSKTHVFDFPIDSHFYHDSLDRHFQEERFKIVYNENEYFKTRVRFSAKHERNKMERIRFIRIFKSLESTRIRNTSLSLSRIHGSRSPRSRKFTGTLLTFSFRSFDRIVQTFLL